MSDVNIMAQLTERIRKELTLVYDGIGMPMQDQFNLDDLIEQAEKSFTDDDILKLRKALKDGRKVKFTIQSIVLFEHTVAPRSDGTYGTYKYDENQHKMSVAFDIFGADTTFDVCDT